MAIGTKLRLNDVRPEARKAVEGWALKADDQYKKRYYKFFSDGPEGASPMAHTTSRGSGGTGGSQFDRMPSMDTFEAAEKELELKNWATSYQTTNNSLGPALAAVKKRASSDAGRVLEPLVKEVLKPKARSTTVADMLAVFNESEKNEFVKLMRSLSIAYEQHRTAYSSEYFIQYEPKKVESEPAPKQDFRASSLSAPVTWAPPKIVKRAPALEMRQGTPAMMKPAQRPEGQKGLLAWAGGKDQINTTYRTFHAKPSETYPHVPAERHDVSLSCGRTVPDHLVPDKHRDGLVVLPWDMESRHRLKHKRPQAQPSWHLLYKEGVVYTDKPGPHDRGENSIYMKDFVTDTSTVKPSKPTLDPFGSSITIGMSDYPYHTTTYQVFILLLYASTTSTYYLMMIFLFLFALYQ
jgi:hypothetical protein